MSHKMVSRNEFECLLEELCASFGAEIYEQYAGRFMYGDRCWGVTVRPAVAKALREEALRMGFGEASSDQLGLDMIVYWPLHSSDAEEYSVKEYEEEDWFDEDAEDDYVGK